ncbi:phosphotransferase family protein [candidate division KSB1 bacterium]|nr:phosphotransferase family protein [candidate division KSB1 bacterium]
MNELDQPRAIRAGEELNTNQLEAYLKAKLSELLGSLAIQQFPSGYSNLTYLLRFGERELVLRRPPFGAKIKTAHDMAREYRILTNLIQVYPKVPMPLLYCDDESIIGAPFYVMERVKGVILRAKPPAGINLSPELMRRLSGSCIDNLVAIHRIDYGEAGLSGLGKPEGYVERQIRGWTQRYQNARTDDIPEIDRVIEWLNANLPAESGAALIHNDYKYDNLVLDPDDLSNLIAVLDWEMATIGDPLMDLGTTLSLWIEADDPPEVMMFGLTALPGNLNREQLVERYAQKSGRDIPHVVFYYVYGLFKIAVIVQQIYSRYKQGLTHDKRFAPLIHVVRACGKMAVLAMAKKRITRLWE